MSLFNIIGIAFGMLLCIGLMVVMLVIINAAEGFGRPPATSIRIPPPPKPKRLEGEYSAK